MNYTPLLHQLHPSLNQVVQPINLGINQTPIENLVHFQKSFNIKSLWMKRDDLNHPIYGGNKIRKLEYLLAQANQHKKITTFGYTGSNHCVATSFFAKQLKIPCQAILLHQANSYYLRENLMWHARLGTTLLRPKELLRIKNSNPWSSIKRHYHGEEGTLYIPPGGTNHLSTLGFINAAFELKIQLEKENIPEPDHIYVPCGTIGTFLGLIIGCRLAGMKTQVIGTRVVSKSLVTSRVILNHLQSFNEVGKKWGLPDLTWTRAHYRVHQDSFGKAYGKFFPSSSHLVEQLYDSEQILLEGCYTGKNLNAIKLDSDLDLLANKNVMIWNTFHQHTPCLLDSQGQAPMDLSVLPKSFHKYFQRPVQAGDFNPFYKA